MVHISSRGPRSCWRCGSLGRMKPKEPGTSVPSRGSCSLNVSQSVASVLSSSSSSSSRSSIWMAETPATCVALFPQFIRDMEQVSHDNMILFFHPEIYFM